MGCLPLLAAALLAVAPAPAATSAPAPALAPTPMFRHYGIEHGLPSSDVYLVVQDRRGVLWFGTVAGMARFDGTHFTVYRHVPGDAASLASNDVSAIVADSEGRLWAGGEGNGVNLYDPATNGFRHFRHQPGRADSLAGDDVMVLAQGPHGSLWVGTYGHGLDHMTSPGHFVHMVHDPHDAASLASNNVLALYSRAGTLWVGTDKGLDMRRPDGTLVHVHFDGIKKSPMVFGITSDATEVRVATAAGLFRVDAAGQARLMYPGILPRMPSLSSARDRHGNLWVGTSAGLYLVHDGHASHFPGRPLLPGGQPGGLVWDLMLDHEGGLWLTSKNAGVAYLRPGWNRFSHFAHRPDDPTSLTGSHVDALVADGTGHLWVGGGLNQLDLLDPATGAVTHYGTALGPVHRSIRAMALAGSHGVWLGFAHHIGLFDHGRFHLVRTPAGTSAFVRMASAADGTLYIAPVGKGMYRVDRRTFAARELKLAFANDLDLQTSALLMHAGQLWRASHAGLSRLAADGTHFVPVPGVATGDISALAIKGDDLWLLRKDGLEHYHLHGGHAALVRRIGAAAGWPGMVAYSMVVDGRGRVWMFANAGLWQYDPASGRFQKYGTRDGLPSPDFTARNAVRMRDGAVFAGTARGVIGFLPTAIHDVPHAPRLEISSIVVRRHNHDVELPRRSHQLHLRWDDRDLRITALGLSYLAPHHIHYRFYLTGLDTDWVDTGTHAMRELAGLPAGHYELKIQAAGPSGTWAHLAAPLGIRVDAPPWVRPWAWVAYALAILVGGYLLFIAWRHRVEQRHRVQLAEQHRQLAEQASAAKTRFLANLGHEIRTPMTGVLGMAELLLHDTTNPRQRSYVEAIRHSGELLLKLVNDALDLARIEAGRLELDALTLDPRALLADVHQLLLGQAGAKGLALTVAVDADVPAYLQGDALRIKQILLNLANNAIKFTRHGSVRLRAGWSGGELALHVIDTGPGISDGDRERLFQRFEQADSPERSSGSGLGLAICRELVALMHGRIVLESTPGQGSHFAVYLPLAQVAAPPRTVAPAAPAHTAARRVLLVEDDATVAAVIQGLLEARGHHVAHAAHGLDALAELERGQFDMLMLDLDLPGLDGYQLAGMIRARTQGGDIPIAAITARSGGDEEPRARAAGMDAFARKPLTGEQLAALLEDLCPQPPP